MAKGRLLTAEQAAEMLGYAHVESFRRAVRNRVLTEIEPVKILSSRNYKYLYRLHEVRAQARRMPRLGRPLEGEPTVPTRLDPNP